MESSNLWAKRVLGTLQRGDGNLGKGCCAAPVPVAQMPLVSGLLLEWVPSCQGPRLGQHSSSLVLGPL